MKAIITKLILISIAFMSNAMLFPANAQTHKHMKKRILFVVTSHDQKGNTGEHTGFYLSEVAHPWEVLTKAGYEIDFVSPKGGKAPIDGFDLEDPVNKKFWNNTYYRNKIENTMKPEEVNPDNYVAIHYAGGHGTMWDFADNAPLARIAASIYENNGIFSAVCHGPAGLVNIKLSNGQYLIDGKKVNAFTNEEETAVKLDQVVPYLLESKLIERGAVFEKSNPWQTHVTADTRLITGQNPQSAKAVGEAVLELLNNENTVATLTRFDVNTGNEEVFKQAITKYVGESLKQEGNIMSEAFTEQENPKTIWLIERWQDKKQQEAFSKTAAAKKVNSLGKEVLIKKPLVYSIKDLEPLTKQQWRKTTKKEDEQLVIMLFVDARKGTEQQFKDTYHIAMPQFRSEPGVVTYQLSEVEGDGTLFVTYEKFRSNDAFQYHLNFPPIIPVIQYLETDIKEKPFQKGLHTLIEFAPLTRE